jgi:hypothetical protein
MGEGERIVAAAITERFTLTADGEFEAQVERIDQGGRTDPGGMAVSSRCCGTPSIWPSTHNRVLRKIPPHLGSVVEVDPDEAEVWVSQRRSVDESKMRLRFGQLKGEGSLVDRVHRDA